MRLGRDVLIMPARDYLHNIVKNALIKDGWIITHDPFTIVFGTRLGRCRGCHKRRDARMEKLERYAQVIKEVLR